MKRRRLRNPGRVRALLDDPNVRAAIDADLQRRAEQIRVDARSATRVRTGRTDGGAEVLRVASERLDTPPELEP